mgnify:CR=1 FL=1
MSAKLPHNSITPIGQDRPAAIPSLWNDRYKEIDANFEALSKYVPSGVCTTSAGNTNKAVACANFVLDDGVFFVVKFSNDNTAVGVSLNVNGTGAKPIRYKGEPVAADKLVKGGVLLLRYDGTAWDVVGNVDDLTSIEDSDIDALFPELTASATAAGV